MTRRVKKHFGKTECDFKAVFDDVPYERLDKPVMKSINIATPDILAVYKVGSLAVEISTGCSFIFDGRFFGFTVCDIDGTRLDPDPSKPVFSETMEELRAEFDDFVLSIA